ncbi:MAG: hypothetical protein M5U12_18615 [Verrucomicrobia bacterium]|nr:hypothetical protein [Verrucomicrobiota bacterium]
MSLKAPVNRTRFGRFARDRHASEVARRMECGGFTPALRARFVGSTWLACAALLLAGVRCGGETSRSSEPPRSPRLAPDYREVVIPPNLAPLNLAIREPGREYALRITGSLAGAFEVRQSHPAVRFPGGVEAPPRGQPRRRAAVEHRGRQCSGRAAGVCPV